MRWIKPRGPESGDRRIVRKFLFFPTTPGDETRWLEWTYVLQEYRARYSDGRGVWSDEIFVDEAIDRQMFAEREAEGCT